MIPDTPRIHITADDYKCFGYSINTFEVEGYAYSLPDQPRVDVVTFLAPDGTEIQMDPHNCFKAGDKAICEILWAEALTPLNLDRLHQAFVDHAYEASLSERGDRLRVVAAE